VAKCTTVKAANLCPSLNDVDAMVKWVQDVLVCDISFPLRGESLLAVKRMRHVYTEHGFAIAALDGLLRIAPTINNSASDINNVVDEVGLEWFVPMLSASGVFIEQRKTPG